MRHTSIAFLMIVLATAGGVGAATLNVGPGETYTTIQAAINAAAPSDIIQVAAGTYAERITITKPLDVRGAQYGVDPTPAGARTNPANESIIDITGIGVINPNVAVEIPSGVSNVSVAGFTLIGSPTFHYADEAVVRCWDDNITIQDNIVDGYLGILYKGNDYLTIQRNRLTARKNGVVVQPNPATHVTVAGNKLTLGTPVASDEAAIYLATCTTCSVTGNTASGFPSRALHCSGVSQLLVSGNNFTGNRDGVSVFGGSTFVTITDNNLSNNTRYGINIKGADLKIERNQIRNNAAAGISIDTHVIPTRRVAVHYNSITGNAFGVQVVSAAETVDAEHNWWGDPSGPGSVGPGSGDKVSAGVDYDPWLTKPVNYVYLEPEAASIYVKPTEIVFVDMNVASLAQPVIGLQAMLKFSSAYFKADQQGDVTVDHGGGVWEEVIYSVIKTTGDPNAGDLDVAVGVQLGLAAGTQADAVTAVIKLTPTGTQGLTQIEFRPDPPSDPELIRSTFLVDTSGNPVWPSRPDIAPTIYIDGEPPEITDFAASTLCTTTSTNLTFFVSDYNAGMDYVDVLVDGGVVAHAVTSPYALDMSGYATDCYDVAVRAVDKAGNESETSPLSVCVDKALPAISGVTAVQGVRDVLCPSEAEPGVVDIHVTATDAGCADMTRPTVAVAGIGDAAYVDESGDTWHYQVTVTTATAAGSHTITVTAADSLGNSVIDASRALCVEAPNILQLVPRPEAIYIRPGESILVDMNVSNLRQMVTGCQAMLGYSSTYFADPTGGAVAAGVVPGGGPWDQLIYDSWAVGAGIPGEIDTAIGVYSSSTTGTDADSRVAIITLTSRLGVEATTRMVFRPNLDPDPGLIKSTFLSDVSSAPIWPTKLDSTDIYIDGTAPLVSVDAAVESATDVLDGANPTFRGTVDITVSASDAFTGLAGVPAVVLTNGPNTATLTTTDTVSPFHYTWVVDATTASGTWTITATAADKAGNTAADADNYLVVINNQITGTVSFSTLSDDTYAFARNVAFVATSSSGAVLKTWTVSVAFTNTPATTTASGAYTLNEVPAGTVNLSAKTAWQLRQRVPVALDVNGNAFGVAFTLLSGDLNGSNSINILDYSVMRSNWYTSNAVADVNGDGDVQGLDYSLMKSNWFRIGDPE
jgi:nitrous oxidase accessory protein NosD